MKVQNCSPRALFLHTSPHFYSVFKYTLKLYTPNLYTSTRLEYFANGNEASASGEHTSHTVNSHNMETSLNREALPNKQVTVIQKLQKVLKKLQHFKVGI